MPLALFVVVVLQIAVTPVQNVGQPPLRGGGRLGGARDRPRSRAAARASSGTWRRRAHTDPDPPGMGDGPVRHPSDRHASGSRWPRPGGRATAARSGRVAPDSLSQPAREVDGSSRAATTATDARPTAVAAGADYPVTFDVEYPERLSRWKIFLKWLFAIPQFIIVYLLGIVAGVLIFIALLRGPVHEEVAARPVRLHASDPALDVQHVRLRAAAAARRVPAVLGRERRVPADARGRVREDLSRWQIFVKWLLAIPHLHRARWCW